MDIIRTDSPGHHRVDLAELDRQDRSWWSLFRWLPASPERTRLDPRLMTLACTQVLDSCALKDPEGRPIVGGEWSVELAERDWQFFQPFVGTYAGRIQRRIQDRAKALKAQVGAIELSFSPNGNLAAGQAIVRVESAAFDPDLDEGPGTERSGLWGDDDDPDNIPTERAGGPMTRRRAPAPVPSTSPPVARLRCGPHVLGLLRPGIRYTLGRRGGGGRHFLALPTSSETVSRRHLRLEVFSDQVAVERLAGNPVAVGSRQLGTSKEMRVALGSAPVSIELTNGELELLVERL